jgi:hypothetical protein
LIQTGLYWVFKLRGPNSWIRGINYKAVTSQRIFLSFELNVKKSPEKALLEIDYQTHYNLMMVMIVTDITKFRWRLQQEVEISDIWVIGSTKQLYDTAFIGNINVLMSL